MPTLDLLPAHEHPELLAPPVFQAIKDHPDVQVVAIDPDNADSQKFIEHYGTEPNAGANCVIVEASRNGQKNYAAVLIQPGRRADLNNTVRKHLDARRVSFAPKDFVLEQTSMEYGSITAPGLPSDWPVLIDAPIMSEKLIVMGSGLRQSKLFISPQTLKNLTNGEVLALSL